MDKSITINQIDDFNKLFGFQFINPLIGIYDLSKATTWQSDYILKYNVYTIFMKDITCGDIRYGKKEYDYSNGTILSFAPGQSIEVNITSHKPTSIGLMFHPDLISGTRLWNKMKYFTFFSYTSSEALHLSEEEREIFLQCLKNIEKEIVSQKDRHTRNIILQNIELLFDYCLRFYERQFITHAQNNDYIGFKFTQLLNDYYKDNISFNSELPTVSYFANKFNLSKNYFSDYIKKTTGYTVMQHIQNKILEVAKYQLHYTNKNISEIAFDLGFKYPQHFSRFFRKNIGCSPYRYKMNNKF